MSVHRDKHNNSWYVKYQNHTKRGFKYKKDAIEYEASLMLAPSNGSAIVFSEFADDYLRYKKTEVQYTTYLKYKECINIVMKPLFPNKPIDEITYSDCLKFKEDLGRLDYSTSYKNKLMIQLKGMFNYGIRQKYLTDNPAKLLTNFRKDREEIEKNREREDSVWNFEEFSRFAECIEDERYKMLFTVLFATGMRLGEALALCWRDFKNKKLSITKTCTKQTEQHGYEIKIPKSQSSIRTVSINDSVNTLLLEYKDHCRRQTKTFSENDFMFGGKSPLSRTCIDRVKDRAIKKSGVKRIRIHDIRHSHATLLINNGLNIVAVSRRLGHSDVNMTLKVYTHLLEKSDHEITDFLEKSSHKSSQKGFISDDDNKKTA